MEIIFKIVKGILLTIVTLGVGLFLFGWLICGGGIQSGGFFIVLVFAVFLIGFLWRIAFKKSKGNEKRIIKVDFKEYVNLNNNQKMILDYVMSSRKKGLEDQDIVDNLKNEGGWSQKEIDEIYEIIEKKEDRMIEKM